ncbi:unnamed protein product (macronuclear) [Paramecium tetraurelia]|uniref:BRCT domain-containing protein n=1 Tax=Paramecium tetraurelia TaxID=5888 RepID=A0D335_PARTE|nr:uncharacterized protein GSPATT00012937001 [Paramecium tetraurelia]CAK77452.1 unnamed protein product [Paramecium tetraurelia]|eukprot:XP_001444849.1 hypothetical protein (macronuclear) [Paramecium tetraurelia strain d4-2]
MFKDISFMFPLSTVNLTNTRIRTLSSLIESNGGEMRLSPDALMIVGSDATVELCQKQFIKFNLDFEQYRYQFLNADWVSQSLLHKKLQQKKKFQLFPQVEFQPVLEEVPELTTKLVYVEALAKTVPVRDEMTQQDDGDTHVYNIKDVELRTNYEKRMEEFRRDIVKEYRQILDYEYDYDLDNFHNQIDDGYEYLLEDLSILKKEEPQILESEKFYGDDDCLITETRKVQFDILDGLDLGKSVVNVDQPILSAQLKETKQFNPGLKRKQQFWEAKKGYFVCEAGAAHKCQNNEIIEELEKLLKIYTNEKNKGRCIAYRKAIGLLKALPYPIKSSDDLKDMPTIGDKIKKEDNRNYLEGQEKNVAIGQLSRVWGIGPTTAATFYFKGIRTLEDLRKNKHLLNRNQQVGLHLVEDLEQRIPREEATLIYEIVKERNR